MAQGTIAELSNEIAVLKRKRNAVILAHNYQLPEVQDVADILGDSLELAKRAMETDADVIVFCGVDFMAESAAILNPEKRVLMPEPDSKCPMAGMVDADGLRHLKAEHPGAKVVTYINSTAEVKTESDICCTSANAVNVVRNMDADTIIFVPDTNLGLYVSRFIEDKMMIYWPGYCHVHKDITVEQLGLLKKQHPGSDIMVHPECRPDVIDAADFVFSTQGMINHARDSDAQEFIVGTEKEHAYRLRKLLPGKTFHYLDTAVCPNMKKITLQKVRDSLVEEKHLVTVPPDIAERALMPLQRMMEVKRRD
jgi:quinolinate synthase